MKTLLINGHTNNNNELEALSKLSKFENDHVVKYIEHFNHDLNFMIVTEYIEVNIKKFQSFLIKSSFF